MKLTALRHLIIISSLATGLILTISCKKNVINEVKVPDFATLSTQFKTPGKEYTTAPFFVWNAEITKNDIDSFLVSFKNAGSSQVIIHPRPGLITEYLSQEWFDLYKHAVEKGKELDMNVWIYDENSYPSGFAGGHVPTEMPESYNQGQGLKMERFETLPDTCDKYYLCLKEENGTFKDITSSLSDEKGKTGKFILFSKTYNKKSDWFGGTSYVDLLYPGVTQKFIEITMSGYEKYIGSEFGKSVPGTFTDEPQINSPGGIRWTPDLFDAFMKQWHYDLKTQLPSLFEEVGDWKKIRHNYTQTLLQLFIDRWSKPWYSYCEEKGLKFTGHYWEHEWPNMRPGGDNMAMYAWHHVPAIDMLFNEWNDTTPNAQFGNVRAVKELASAANQTGRQQKLSETYGGSGWDLSFTDMKRNGDWEYALGVNLMNQHLTYFTLAGARKYDYPPSFDYHEPWWKDYKYINDHYARLSLALSAGKQINDILILEPTTSAWLYDSYVNSNKKCAETGRTFQTFITKIEMNQVEYDLGSENIIKDRGNVTKGRFVVGQTGYSKVVVPPLTENLNTRTYDLLREFVSKGGTLIAFSVPTLVDGAPSEEIQKFFNQKSDRIILLDKLTPEVISKYLENNNLGFEGVKEGTLYHHRRILSDGQLIFLVNSSLTGPINGSFTTRGKDAIEMNTLTGEIYGYQYKQDGDNIRLSYSIPPAGSLLLYIPDKKITGYTISAKTENKTPVMASSPLKVSRNEDNALMIDFCDLKIGKNLIKDIHVAEATDTVFKIFGFKNGDPWNTSVQYKTNIIDRDTFKPGTGFTATFHFTIKGSFDFSNIKTVIERPWLWTVSVNGIEVKPEKDRWWLDRSFGVFNIGANVRTGDNTITLHTSPMKIHAETGFVYVLGNFSLKPAEKGWVIEKPASEYTMGKWKDQGMPFYSWGVTYSREFNIEKNEGTWEIGLTGWNGTIAEVYVNGKPAEPVAFPPYLTNVTSLIKPGINKIDVKVIGSLKNLLGPHHKEPRPGFVTPNYWKKNKSYPAGKDYHMTDYGLFEDFILFSEK
ncbi:MAG TPA: glycosyl hydrolase [Bacteroidales bacterium]|nr:glycosyl hydrolase [Bacteroidales bacterium]